MLKKALLVLCSVLLWSGIAQADCWVTGELQIELRDTWGRWRAIGPKVSFSNARRKKHNKQAPTQHGPFGFVMIPNSNDGTDIHGYSKSI